jgi:hypothetical protein
VRAEALAAAEAWCALLDDANGKAKAEGLFCVPEKVMETLVKPMAYVCANMYVPEVPPEKLAPGVVIGASAIILFQGNRANKIRAEREGRVKPKAPKVENGEGFKPGIGAANGEAKPAPPPAPIAEPIEKPTTQKPPTTERAGAIPMRELFPAREAS